MPIQETSFAPKSYLTLRRAIAISQVSDHQMYDDAGKKLGAYMQKHGLHPSGPWTVLYFLWDVPTQRAELGIAFPIDGLTAVDDAELTVVAVPQCKAATDALHGPYEGLGDVHRSLVQYMADKGYSRGDRAVQAVEEYVVDPMREPNPANWVTQIYYLHD